MAKKASKPAGLSAVPPYLQGDEKRTVILRAAHKLFLRDGVLMTSIDAVVEEAGVSKSTVYAHFDGKDQLFETLLRLGSENALRMVPPLVRAGGEPGDELLAFFGPFLELIFRGGGYAWSRMVIAEAVRLPENARLFHTCTIERITRTVQEYLAALSSEGRFPAGEEAASAEALVAMVLLGPLHRATLLGPDSVDHQASLRHGVALLLRSIKASAGS